MPIRRIAAPLVAGLLVALGTHAVHAATWRSVGPSIGWTTDFAEDPTQPGRFLATIRGQGLLVSENGGAWHGEATGLDGQPIGVLAFAPSVPSIVYAGSGGTPPHFGRGVFRSSDGGRTWVPRNSQMEVSPVFSLAVDATDPDVVYAAVGGPFLLVMRTVDGGTTWTDFSGGLTQGVSGLTLLAGTPQVLVAIQSIQPSAFAGPLLRRELAEGGDWISSGVPVQALAVDRARSRLWAARANVLLLSDDAGVTFSQLPPSPRPFVPAGLAVEPSSGRVYVADRGQIGSFSPEEGWRWSDLPLPTLPTKVLVEAQGHLRVGTDGAGFFVSVDGGLTWRPDAARLSAAIVHQLAFDPLWGSMLLGTRGGLFRSENGGRSWIVKVLDACSFTGRYWVFAGGLTDVEVDLAVDDVVSGEHVTYTNPLRTPFQPIQDTAALPCGDAGQAGAASAPAAAAHPCRACR